jgi:hypothetical protein
MELTLGWRQELQADTPRNVRLILVRIGYYSTFIRPVKVARGASFTRECIPCRRFRRKLYDYRSG